MTMTKMSSKKTCYTYGHGPLINLLHSWKLPACSGAFLLSKQLCFGDFCLQFELFGLQFELFLLTI